MRVRIITAAHKPYALPGDTIYLPVQVGSLGRESIGFARDDSGENISGLNPLYCELTAVYWAWKNLLPEDADYVGLAHYRRHFTSRRLLRPGSATPAMALTGAEAQELCRRHDIILPRRRRYYIETMKSHFEHAHGRREFELLRQAVEECRADCLPAFDAALGRTWGHICNMFIMRRDYFDAYCAWLFPLLACLDDQFKRAGLTPKPRLYGFMAERMLDVWLLQNRLPYGEINCLLLESPGWPRKIAAFLKRKFAGCGS